MKPAPGKLTLVMSAIGVGLLLPDHALAHPRLHARLERASALGLGTGAVPTCHALDVGALAECQLANREALLHASALVASMQAPWPPATAKSPHLIEARWTQWSVGSHGKPSAPRRGTPDASIPDFMPGETRHLATQASVTAAPPTLGKPNEAAARPDAKGIEHTSAGSDRDREANAIAMVLMEDPPTQAQAPASAAAVAPLVALAPVATVVSAVASAPLVVAPDLVITEVPVAALASVVAVAPVLAAQPLAEAMPVAEVPPVAAVAKMAPAAAKTTTASLVSVENALDPKATEQTIEREDREREANAIAMVLMADPPSQVQATTQMPPVTPMAPAAAVAAATSVEAVETAGLPMPSAPLPGSIPQVEPTSAISDLDLHWHEHVGDALAVATQITLTTAPSLLGRPKRAAAQPDPNAAARTSESRDRDREANAIAMILMVDPSSQAGVPAPVAAVAQAASKAAAASPATVEIARGTTAHIATADSFLPPREVSSDATNEGAVRAADVSAPLPSQRPEQRTPTLATREAVAGTAEAQRRLVEASQEIAPTAAPAIALKPGAIDQMRSAVGEPASSRPEPPASTWPARTAAATTPNRGPAPIAPAALPVLESTVAEVPIDAVSRADKARRQLGARPEIVVATHGDKVLMSLAALRSDEGPEAGRYGAQTKETVVVRHADKVLLNLASLQAEKARKPARCKVPPAADLRRDPLAPPNTVECPVPEAGSATSAVAGHNLIGGDAVALSGDQLDEVRGGFVTDAGLQISFGIERAIYLNGNLVTTTSLNMTELGKVSTGQTQLGVAGTGGVTLIQSGAGNTFLPGAISPSAVGTVIQNSLDNQKFQTITRIDAAVSAAGALRALNLQSSLRGAITNSLRR